jgi:phosphoglycerate dehydrogenase-like enzyme
MSHVCRVISLTIVLALCTSAINARAEDALPKAPPVQPDSGVSLVERYGLEESKTPVRERPGWTSPRKVLVWNRAPGLLPNLQSAAPGVELLPAANERDAVRLAADADAVIGFCSEDVLAAGPRLKWVQVFWAGVEDCVSVPALRERGILLTNMQRVAGPVMAEHVIAMMLAFARGLQFFIPERQAGRWTKEPPAPVRLITIEGKNVLVVGLGGIGTEVARRAHALGMRVTATRATSRQGPEFVSYVGLPDELHKLAADADFIVNTTPLTPQTTGIVVQTDLIAALGSGGLAGAGLDVTDPEPLPANSPLWKMQNVIITPHVSGHSDLGIDARVAVIRENLRRYVAGERMLSEVDLGKGY